ERQVLVGEAERGRGETRVLAVVVDEAPGGGQAAQEVGDPAEHEEGKADRDNDGRRLEGPAGPHRAVTQRVGLPLMGAEAERMIAGFITRTYGARGCGFPLPV